MSDENQEVSYVAPVSAPESEATAAPEDVEIEAQEGQEDGPEQPEQKTFTQEEVNRIAAERAAKAERKVRRELQQQAQEAQRPANGPQPTYEQFNGDAAAFVEALSDWKADQKLMEREHQTRQVSVEAAFEERVEKAREEKYPDFDDVVGKPYEEGGPAIVPLMHAAIMAEENGADIAYHLGKNVKESIRIATLPPAQQLVEIGKLAVVLAGKAPTVKKVSSAPEPIRPIAGSTPTTLKYGVDDPRSDKSMSHSEWIEQRNKTAPR